MLDLEITARDLATHLKSNAASTILLDVREPWEIATAHINGSKDIPMGEIPARVFQELDPEAHIVTVCHGRGPFPQCRGVDAEPGFARRYSR